MSAKICKGMHGLQEYEGIYMEYTHPLYSLLLIQSICGGHVDPGIAARLSPCAAMETG